MIPRTPGHARPSAPRHRPSAPRHRPWARRHEAGFTLVELLVVLAIIGLLATLVVINVAPIQGRAQQQKARADMAVIEQALQIWRLETGRFPTSEEGLAALTVPGPMGPALETLPDDPWGRPYRYRSPGLDGRAYDLWSLGADGEEGGEGADADILSWAR